jgi:hypothetical protein
MTHMEVEVRNRDEKTAMGMNLRSHSLDKLRQIITTAAAHPVRARPVACARQL